MLSTKGQQGLLLSENVSTTITCQNTAAMDDIAPVSINRAFHLGVGTMLHLPLFGTYSERGAVHECCPMPTRKFCAVNNFPVIATLQSS